jgi:hypothetical protein
MEWRVEGQLLDNTLFPICKELPAVDFEREL